MWENIKGENNGISDLQFLYYNILNFIFTLLPSNTGRQIQVFKTTCTSLVIHSMSLRPQFHPLLER